MTGKLEHIRNNDSLLILPCLATNAKALLDGVASDIALERPQFQRITIDNIESAPKIMKKRRMEESRYIGQRPDMIVNVLNQRFYLGNELLVCLGFLHLKHLLHYQLLFLQLALAVLTDVQAAAFVTKLLVCLEFPANLAVTSTIAFLLHSR